MGILFRFLLYVLPSLIFLVFIYLYLSSPVYNGYITHSYQKYGIVYIRRDQYGIPTIKGNQLKDTLFGLGYVHCQDRQWNMDLSRRLATGRLSELFGNQTLEMDISQREFGFLDLANNLNLNQKDKESLQAYTDGVNECHLNKRIKPLEYFFTRNEFEEWKIEDTISIIMMFQVHLSQDYIAEIFRERMKKRYEQRATQIMSIHWENGYISEETIMSEEDVKKMGLYEFYNKTEILLKTQEDKAPNVSEDQIEKILKSGLPAFFDSQKGSNTWVIHGNHTTTGKPIVANDPHLNNGIPSFWYQAHLIYQNDRNITVSGSSVPGVPGIFSGITDYVSWGVTALRNDITDLYSETLNDQNTQYFFDGKWRDLKLRNELIKIKGQKPHLLTVKETHHGPIINSKDKQSNLALCWANRIKNFNFILPLQNLYESTNVNSVLDSFSRFQANFGIAFGTSDNHIGFYATGLIPLRNDPKKGSFIQDGTNRNNDWLGFLPQKQNPHLIDPDRGFIVAANNKITPKNAKGFPSINMPPNSRAVRIREMIEKFILEGKKISVQNIKEMQQDDLDVYARQVSEPIQSIYEKHKNFMIGVNKTKKYDEMMAQLKNWNHRFDLESVGATIFIEKQSCLLLPIRNIPFNQIQKWADDRDTDGIWCDDPSCYSHKTKCLKLFINSVIDTYNHLQQQLGSDMSEWKWKKVHYKQLPHSTFKNIAYVNNIFGRSFPSAGNKRTVNVNIENHQDYDLNSILSANMRAVYSLDSNDKSYFILDTGISENLISSHYTDQLALYEKGEYIEIKRDLDKLKENNVEMLLLVYDPYKEVQSQFSSNQKQKTETQNKQKQEQEEEL